MWGRPPESSNISFGTGKSQTSLKCGQFAARAATTFDDFFFFFHYVKIIRLKSANLETSWTRGERLLGSRVTTSKQTRSQSCGLRAEMGSWLDQDPVISYNELHLRRLNGSTSIE